MSRPARSRRRSVRRPPLGAFALLGGLALAARFAIASPDVPDAAVTSQAAPLAAEPVLGDAFLRGDLDLSQRVLVDDRYVVPLSGGRRAVLTLDPVLQARAEAILAQAKAPYGAAVVMAPDGRILALAGASTVEPTRAHELATHAWAPSASIFKIVTGAALVEAGVPSDTRVCYHGGLRSVDADNLVDDPRRDGACETLAYGLAKSQNAIVAKLAARSLTVESLSRMATAFGYGTPPSFALPAGPSTVSLPSEPLEFARAAAGFWHSELSPLGGALLADTVASGGLAVTPRLVAEVIGDDGRVQPIVPVPARRVLPESTAKEVAAMMVGTTTQGTGRKAFTDAAGRPAFDVAVAGKTGSLSKNEPYLGYSWFVAFAPAEAPRYVVSVVLGNSPTWHLKAHTASRMLFDTALGRETATRTASL